ncbi:hypothetical protein HLB30_07495 [Peptostreptococcus russellii]|uniref:hypothetical protein n=1 Tax=Peptostreptococcus russellii TaxID=215200 RepID=UPI0016247B29|nr:hypothetical protein [Peptostreptococcus russellii]MBC2578358.1 hypothetical protein [Peptostreptococcus russellii]
MDVALELLKLKLGITTNKRDVILINVLESVLIELKEVQGIKLELKNKSHLFFLIDYAEFRYKGGGVLPRHLQWRMNNFYIKVGGKND